MTSALKLIAGKDYHKLSDPSPYHASKEDGNKGQPQGAQKRMRRRRLLRARRRMNTLFTLY